MIPGPGCFLLCYFVEKQKEKNLISQKYFISVYRPSGILFMQKQTLFSSFASVRKRGLLSNYTRWKVSAGRKHHNSGHQNDSGIKVKNKMFLWPIKRSARIRPDKPRHDYYRNDFHLPFVISCKYFMSRPSLRDINSRDSSNCAPLATMKIVHPWRRSSSSSDKNERKEAKKKLKTLTARKKEICEIFILLWLLVSLV